MLFLAKYIEIWQFVSRGFVLFALWFYSVSAIPWPSTTWKSWMMWETNSMCNVFVCLQQRTCYQLKCLSMLFLNLLGIVKPHVFSLGVLIFFPLYLFIIFSATFISIPTFFAFWHEYIVYMYYFFVEKSNLFKPASNRTYMCMYIFRYIYFVNICMTYLTVWWTSNLNSNSHITNIS